MIDKHLTQVFDLDLHKSHGSGPVGRWGALPKVFSGFRCIRGDIVKEKRAGRLSRAIRSLKNIPGYITCMVLYNETTAPSEVFLKAILSHSKSVKRGMQCFQQAKSAKFPTGLNKFVLINRTFLLAFFD